MSTLHITCINLYFINNGVHIVVRLHSTHTNIPMTQNLEKPHGYTVIHDIFTLIHDIFTVIHDIFTLIHDIFTLIHEIFTLIHEKYT